MTNIYSDQFFQGSIQYIRDYPKIEFMKDGTEKSVVIIGGGFCGVLTLVNLVEKSVARTAITLINKGYPVGRGIAYSTYSDFHLLNVETRNMSAFPDQPDHFLNWCLHQSDVLFNKEELPYTYLPRNIYGRYLEEILNNTLQNVPEHVQLQILDDEAVDIEKQNGHLNVITRGGKKIRSDKVVLATGNCEPGPPSLSNPDFLKSKNYFGNPWSENAVLGMKETDTVMIIGTGLTMIDVVIGLRENNFKGIIIALSPHGYNILPHRKLPPQRYILDELHPPYDLENLFRLFYRHIREARKRGLSGETVVDAIRARTQEIWQKLTLVDKKKFMTHLRHLWGVARHRLPAHIHQEVQQLIQDYKLKVIAGRIKSISESDGKIDITISKRKDQSELVLTVARVINCTGPQTDIRKQNSPLYNSMLRKGMIMSDDMNLGVNANSEGRIIDKNNVVSKQIFALGSLLKGMLWESTAIPELRVQASGIADMIVNDAGAKHKNEHRETFSGS